MTSTERKEFPLKPNGKPDGTQDEWLVEKAGLVIKVFDDLECPALAKLAEIDAHNYIFTWMKALAWCSLTTVLQGGLFHAHHGVSLG